MSDMVAIFLYKNDMVYSRFYTLLIIYKYSFIQYIYCELRKNLLIKGNRQLRF